MKLRKQVITFIILITIIPIATVAIGSYYYKTKFYIEKERELLTNKVDSIKLMISNFSSDSESLLKFLAKEKINGTDQSFLSTLSNLIKEKNDYVLMYFEYENEKRSLMVSKEYAIDTKFGKLPFEVPKDLNAKLRPWYIGAKNKKGLYLSEIYKDLNTKKNMITISYPVYKNGSLLGVLGFDIDLDALAKSLNVYAIDKDIDFSIFDKNGVPIISNKFGNFSKANDYFKLFSKAKGFGTIDRENSIYTYEYINSINFYIFTKVDKDILLKEFEPINRLIVLVSIISLFISLMYIVTFFEFFEKFIKKISITLSKIAKGDYTNEFSEFSEIFGKTSEFQNIKNALQDMQNSIETREKTLEELANFDTLTKIYNRRYLFSVLDKKYREAILSQGLFSLAILDLDNFKQVNDIYGHQLGDEVLKTFAEETKKLLDSSQIFGRYGGEEFLIIFPSIPLRQAIETCESIRSNTENINFSIPSLKITVSAGVASYNGQSLEKILQEADLCLYDAKKSGKNKVHFKELF